MVQYESLNIIALLLLKLGGKLTENFDVYFLGIWGSIPRIGYPQFHSKMGSKALLLSRETDQYVAHLWKYSSQEFKDSDLAQQ